jgi:hypothetical protein
VQQLGFSLGWWDEQYRIVRSPRFSFDMLGCPGVSSCE